MSRIQCASHPKLLEDSKIGKWDVVSTQCSTEWSFWRIDHLPCCGYNNNSASSRSSSSGLCAVWMNPESTQLRMLIAYINRLWSSGKSGVSEWYSSIKGLLATNQISWMIAQQRWTKGLQRDSHRQKKIQAQLRLSVHQRFTKRFKSTEEKTNPSSWLPMHWRFTISRRRG